MTDGSMKDRLETLSLRLIAIAIGLVFLVSGLVGLPFAVRALQASLAVRWWPERACIVEDLQIVEVPSWFPDLGSGHYELRLLLRDVETGRQWRNAGVSRPPPQVFEVSALSQDIGALTPGAQLDCRVSPDGDTAVVRVSSFFILIIQCFVALFALLCLAGGAYTLWASVQRERVSRS